MKRFLRKWKLQIAIKKEFSEFSCFNTFFDIMATASRADLKVELIQEIEKQRLKFKTKIKTKKIYKLFPSLIE